MALCVAAVQPAVQVQAGMLEESEPNNRPGTANRISLNTWVTGEMTYSDEDWFQFTIPAGRGYTWFQIKPTMNNVYDDSSVYYLKRFGLTYIIRWCVWSFIQYIKIWMETRKVLCTDTT